MKALWSGSISFGLVEIPIKLYSAVTPRTTAFTLLCGTCHHPIKYKRWCDHCQKDVQWHNIVKGVEVKKGSYVVFTQKRLLTLKPLTTDAISIVEFVDTHALDPLHWQTPYYVAPAKQGEKAYYLLLHALEKVGKCAIGTFVMRDKEHVCVIFPYKNVLVLTTLYYAHEVKRPELQQEPSAKINPAELSMAVKLIEQLSRPKFDITRFKDTFVQRLSAHLKKPKKKKIKGAEIRALPKVPKEQNLLTLLETSLQTKGKASSVRARA